jgi:hypothetical protein
MTTLVAVAMAASVPGSARPAAAQPGISNARLERRTVARPLGREIEALSADMPDGWVAYRVEKAFGRGSLCDGGRTARVYLEPASEFLVLVRLEGGAVARLRTVTPDCDVDAGGQRVISLEGLGAEDNATWMATLVSPPTGTSTQSSRSTLVNTAIGALALDRHERALDSLLALARNDPRSRVRSQSLFWLAQRAGQQAVSQISQSIDQDPETEVRRKAVFALSQLPESQGVPLLMQVARTHRDPVVRRQAMFWLGQSGDPRAVSFFEEILTR